MAGSTEPPVSGHSDRPTRHFWRWAGPPEGRDAGWDTDARTEIRWRWGEVCSGVGLTRRVFPEGCRSIPHIGRITLGPPTRFTVRLRPGQSRQDIADIAPRLALAFEVRNVRVRDLATGWVSVEMVEQAALLTVVQCADRPPDASPPAPSPQPRSLRWWPHRRRSEAAESEPGADRR